MPAPSRSSMCSCRCFGSQCVGSSGLVLVWYVRRDGCWHPVDFHQDKMLCCDGDGVYQGLKVDWQMWLRIRGDKHVSRLRCSNFNAVGLRCGYGPLDFSSLYRFGVLLVCRALPMCVCVLRLLLSDRVDSSGCLSSRNAPLFRTHRKRLSPRMALLLDTRIAN